MKKILIINGKGGQVVMEKPTTKILFVKRPYIPYYGNVSGDYANDYTYDYIFYNDCNLSLLKAKFMAYFNNCIKEYEH